jgi:mannose-6-phosphate isomerase
MKKAPIFLAPLFQERIWGGSELKKQYGYNIPSAQTGECWAISAHPNGPSIVREGDYTGKTLGELWDEHPEMFGHKVYYIRTAFLIRCHPRFALEKEVLKK